MSAAKWSEFPCLGFDTETTGVNPLQERIVTVALVEVPPPGGGRPTITRYVVDAGIEIPEGAAAVHGYTRDRAVAEATHTVDQMLFEVAGRLGLWLSHGKPVVAMNASYDFTLFEAECHRNGVEGLIVRAGTAGRVQPIIDPMVMDRYADKYRRGGRKLVDLCATYGVRHTGAHDAAGDSLAACRVWPRIIAKHPRKFSGQTLGGLHQAQIGWRRDQMASLQEHHQSRGKADGDYDRGWPFHTRLAGVLAGAR